ncbi:hypothetical protein B0H12DRAFT_1010783, partial [Mycena haematopus]
DFRFNVEGAILGVLEPLEPGHISASLGLPFTDFIATRYLPCSPVDKAIHKFTGNENCGDPPGSDTLTAAIHAFTHFTIAYTDENLVFCDLQGNVSCSSRWNVSHCWAFQACPIAKES